MVTDCQVRRLMKLINEGKRLVVAAAKSGMDEKTARKYRKLRRLPSQVKTPHTWATRSDPFAGVWSEVVAYLEGNDGLEAKTIFEALQRQYPGDFQDGQLRSLQRKVRRWRALFGSPKEVFFSQVHRPGELAESDFTHLTHLHITIQGQQFEHLLYHFVLSYSNWETGTICFSESFESLSTGLQDALWKLGGVPEVHQTDQLTAAVKLEHPEVFTDRYQALLRHYGLRGKAIQVGMPNQNGDVEQRHHRFTRALDQALRLRGSRDFLTTEAYGEFLDELFGQLNQGRQERFKEELLFLKELPERRQDDFKVESRRVSRESTIAIDHNTYSVNSRFIGERVKVRVYANRLEVWYAERKVETMPRLRGIQKHRIQYRHIIDWLVRKPGAFLNYRYRQDLYPTTQFRMAYDDLRERYPSSYAKEYLKILELAAKESEMEVDQAIRFLLALEQPISFAGVVAILESRSSLSQPRVVQIDPVQLDDYDALLTVPLEATL